MTSTEFPVLESDRKAQRSYVPWAWAETWRAQASLNHGQTLERLAERGGLDWYEMRCAAEGRQLFFNGVTEPMSSPVHRDVVMAMVAAWESR